MPQRSNSTDDEARLDISACGFWVVDFRKPTLMSESSILMLSHIDHQQYHLCTENKSKKRNVNTRLKSEESNKLLSHH